MAGGIHQAFVTWLQRPRPHSLGSSGLPAMRCNKAGPRVAEALHSCTRVQPSRAPGVMEKNRVLPSLRKVRDLMWNLVFIQNSLTSYRLANSSCLCSLNSQSTPSSAFKLSGGSHGSGLGFHSFQTKSECIHWTCSNPANDSKALHKVSPLK